MARFIDHAHPLLAREPDLLAWVEAQFQRLTAREDNPDNFRVAEVGNAADEALYQAALGRGCCGYQDVEVTHRKSGRRFRVGYNYGH